MRVALIERAPKADHYKRACTHYIQAPAVATLDRLGLTEAVEAAGAVPNSVDLWTRYGWSRPIRGEMPTGYDLRREKLDPMLRALALQTPGVDYFGGELVTDLLRDAAGRPAGVVTRDRSIPARVVVGADGRGSTVARLAGVRGRVRPHNRFGYFAYFEGVRLEDPDRSRDVAARSRRRVRLPQ